MVVLVVKSRIDPKGTVYKDGYLDTIGLRDATLTGSSLLCIRPDSEMGKTVSNDVTTAFNVNPDSQFTFVAFFMEADPSANPFDLENYPKVKSLPPSGTCIVSGAVAFGMPNGMRYELSAPYLEPWLKDGWQR